jgi:subtilisin family serine protease
MKDLLSFIYRQKREVLFNDPMFEKQWEINGKNEYGSMRIVEAWAKGYTGKGVVVSILDDGIDYNHTELAQNYVSFIVGLLKCCLRILWHRLI